MKEFARLFTEKRKAKKLSQTDLAKLLNVTRQSVSNWERGVAYPDLALMPKIAEILDVSLDELLTGNEPKKEVVEKEVIVEKEVVKKPSVKRICAIVAPIMIICIVAAALMGVYIPKAIAAAKPPVEQEQNPVLPSEMEYMNIGISQGRNENGTVFSIKSLIDGIAYYRFVPQMDSEYIIEIGAPKGAVAKLDDEVIAEFDVWTFKYFSKYFNARGEKWGYAHVFGEEIEGYKLTVDLRNCDKKYISNENVFIVVKQKVGFEDVTVPANGSYTVAIPQNGNNEEFSIDRYIIKSQGIEFEGVWKCNTDGEYILENNYKNGNEFYVLNRSAYDHIYYNNADYYVKFVNKTNEDIELQVEQKELEEIVIGQEVQVYTNGRNGDNTIYKLKTEPPTILSINFSNENGDLLNTFDFIYRSGNKLDGKEAPWRLQFFEGRCCHFATEVLSNVEYIYVIANAIEGQDFEFVISNIYTD